MQPNDDPPPEPEPPTEAQPDSAAPNPATPNPPRPSDPPEVRDLPPAESELAAREGTRPDMTEPRPLRTPTSPQREHIIAEAEALRRYVEDGGPVDYFRINRPGGRKRVGFVVDRARFNAIRAQIRAEQTGNRPWVWQPKRGLHRSSSGP